MNEKREKRIIISAALLGVLFPIGAFFVCTRYYTNGCGFYFYFAPAPLTVFYMLIGIALGAFIGWGINTIKKEV